MLKFKKMKPPEAAQIRAAREAAKLTQAEAAAICQAGLRTWNGWEAGRAQMHPIFWLWFRECAKAAVQS